jgi:hypothetical protein
MAVRIPTDSQTNSRVSSPNHRHVAQGDPTCKRTLRAAIGLLPATAARAFSRYVFSGFAFPADGAPLSHLRAWVTLAQAAAIQLTYLTETLAIDLAARSDDDGADTAQAAAQARQIAWNLLKRLQPGLTYRDRGGIFSRRSLPMDPFVECLQIRDAIADLAEQLTALLDHCPCNPSALYSPNGSQDANQDTGYEDVPPAW